MISAAALAVIDEVLSHELRHFTDYLADPMMEGQEGLAVAQGEVDRLQPVIDEVRAERAATMDGWMWRPNAKSNRWNFTRAINHERRSYPADSLFVPIRFAGAERTYSELREQLGQ